MRKKSSKKKPAGFEFKDELSGGLFQFKAFLGIHLVLCFNSNDSVTVTDDVVSSFWSV